MFYSEVNIMTNELLLKSLIELIAILVCVMAVYNEAKIGAWEIKFCRFVKCAFKAAVIVMRKQRAAKSNVVRLAPETENSADAEKEKTGGAVRIA